MPVTPSIVSSVPASSYARVAHAITLLHDQCQQPLSLGRAAAAVGLSPARFQREFTRWAGVSPKRFQQYLSLAHARRVLADSSNVLDAAYDSGLSGPGRLHDLLVSADAVTPGEERHRGAGVKIRHGVHDTPFGPALVAATPRGLCSLAFIGPDGSTAAVADLQRRWPAAEFVDDAAATAILARRAFAGAERGEPLAVVLKGTNFQLKVWEALLRVPAGALVSYQALAIAAGHPGAVRAVGTAVGANPIAYLIPCHRVIRATGEFGGYRWGMERKLAIVGRELACGASPLSAGI